MERYHTEGSDERVVYLSNSSVSTNKIAPQSTGNPLSEEGKTETSAQTPKCLFPHFSIHLLMGCCLFNIQLFVIQSFVHSDIRLG